MPVFWLLSDLEGEIITLLLLGEVDVSLTLSVKSDEESLFEEVWLSLVLVLFLLHEGLSSFALVACPPLEGSHVGVLTIDIKAFLTLVMNVLFAHNKNLIGGDLAV